MRTKKLLFLLPPLLLLALWLAPWSPDDASRDASQPAEESALQAGDSVDTQPTASTDATVASESSEASGADRLAGTEDGPDVDSADSNDTATVRNFEDVTTRPFRNLQAIREKTPLVLSTEGKGLTNLPVPDQWENARVRSIHWSVINEDDQARQVTLIEPEGLPYTVRVEELLYLRAQDQREFLENPLLVRALNRETLSEELADHLMIRLEPGRTEADLRAALQPIGAEIVRPLSARLGIYRVALPEVSPDGAPQAVLELAARPETRRDLRTVETDGIVRTADTTPNDTRYSELWGMPNINAPAVWDTRTSATRPDGEKIVIGVIDTGVNYDHPDLADNMWTNPNPGSYGNVITGDIHGINAITMTGDPMDDQGHGTHVSGTIAGVGNNNLGVVGVNWDAEIMGLKFLSSQGSGVIGDAVTCLDYAIANGAHLTNNSWGGGPFTQSFYDMLVLARDQGQLFVAAAGNSANNNSVNPDYPSSYELNNIVAVAAIGESENIASFSSYGPDNVLLAAPGVNVLSTYFQDPWYKAFSGTSMAAPHVTGAAAMLMAEFENETYDVIKARLGESARQLPSLQGRTITEGTLDLEQAFLVAEDGDLSVRVTVRGADDGSVVFAGEQAELTLSVTDLLPVSDATITATADPAGPDGSTIDFDEDLDDPGTYTADYNLPTFAEGEVKEMDVALTVSATGKNTFTDIITLEIQSRPENRFFANALELDATNPGTTVIDNTFAGNREPDEVGRIDFRRYTRSLWYTWTPDTVGSVEINTIGSGSDGVAMETVLAVYTSEVANPTLADLDKIAENAYIELFVNMASRVTFEILEPGTTYYIQAGDAFRPGDLMLNVIPAFGPPIITEAPPASFQVFEGLPIRINGFMAGATDGYRWLKDGVALTDGGRYSGTQSPSLLIDPSIASDAGTYVLRGTNSEDSTDTAGTILSVTEPTGLSSWSSAEPGPTGNDLGGVTVGAGQTVAVGGEGTLLTRDETTGEWSRVSTGTSARLNGIVFDAGDGFVAVGDLGTVLRSGDGASWTTADSGTDQALRSVAYGNGVYLAVGGDHLEGVILRSTDGETWTDVTPGGLDSILYSVTWDGTGNRFVAAGGHWRDEIGIVMASVDGSSGSWSTHTLTDMPTLHSVAAQGGEVIAVGGDWLNPVILRNTGAGNWETRSSPSEETLYSVGHGDTLWVATGERGTLLTSPDALTWTARETGTDFALRGAVWDGSDFVVVGDGGLVLDSADAAAWSVQVPGVRASLEDVTGGGAGLLTVGENGSVIFSADGQAWTPRLTEKSARYLGVATDGSLFVKSSDDGKILSSTNAGESWTTRYTKPYESIDAVVRGGGLYVAAGSGGTVATSSDGTNWTERNSGTSAHLRAVAFNGSDWRAVGSNGTILASGSGTSWSAVASGIEATLRGVTHNGLYWVAVGDQGRIWASADGITWEEVPSPTTHTLYSVSSDSDTTFAVGARGTLLTSADGLVWEKRDSRVSANLLGSAREDGLLIAVGGMGTILSTVALPIVETPEISPELVGSADSVTVSLETATAGAEIRYTLDGTEPTRSSILYTDTFVLTQPTTVRARAFKDAMEPSGVAEREYLIEAAPFILENAEDLAIVTGGSGVLSPEVLGEAPLSYQWQSATDPEGTWSDVTGETDRELSFSNAQSADDAYYRVAVSNDDDSIVGEPVRVWVWDAPVITQDPQDVTAASGSAASFSVTAGGGGTLSYQWRKDGEEISGATGASYELASATLGSAGSYDVVVSSPVGSATSAAATLTVGVPPRIAAHPQSQTVAAGDDVALSVEASGAGLNYQWQIHTGSGFSNISDETGADLTLTAVTSADEGAYRVVVDNAYGSQTSEAATLTVLEAPSITAQPASMDIIEGQDGTFSVVAEGAAPLTYTWFKDGSVVPGGDGANLAFTSVTASDGAAYQVQVSNEVGQVMSNPVTLTVLFPAVITAQPADQDVEIGQNGTFAVEAEGSDLTYQWQENVEGSWQDVTGEESASLTVTTVAVEDDGREFRVVVDNAYGPAVTSTSAILNVLAPVNITAQPQSQSIELNNPVTFSVTAAGADLSYQWRRNGSNISGATGASYTINSVSGDRDGDTYSVRVSNAVSSETSSDATLTVLFPPTILAQPQSRTVSAGETVSFSVLAEGSGTLVYQWSKDGVDLTGENAATLTLTDVQEADAGSYQVNVSNDYGNVDSVAVDLGILVSFDFAHGMRITFDGYTESETLTNFPVPVKFEEDPTVGFSYNDFVDAANGSDLRFWNATLDQQLVYEIEQWDQNGASYVWVRVPELSPDTVIYASWGDDQAAAVPESPANTWSADFLAAWHLQETPANTPDSATIEFDNTAVASPGNSSEDPVLVPGVIGQGIQTIPQTSHRLELTNVSHLAGREQASFSFWYRRDVQGGENAEIFSRPVSGTNRRIGYAFETLDYDDGISLYASESDDPTIYSGTLPTDAWFHVTVTQNKTGSNSADFEMYINGDLHQKLTDQSLNESAGRWILEPTFLLGGSLLVGRNSVPWGSVDEMRMAGAVRSAAWVKAEYLSMSDPQTFGTLSSLNDVPNVPIITLTQPLTNEVRIPENVGLQLEAEVTEAVEESGNLTFLWEVLSGPSGATIETPGTLQTAAFFPGLGEYTLRLLVENSEDASLSAQEFITVTVTDEINEAGPLEWTGTSIELTGGAFTFDGQEMFLEAQNQDGSLGGDTDMAYFVSVPVTTDGTLTARLTQNGAGPGVEDIWSSQVGLMVLNDPGETNTAKYGLTHKGIASSVTNGHYFTAYSRPDPSSAGGLSQDRGIVTPGDVIFRLERSGNTVIGSVKNSDGNFEQVSSENFPAFSEEVHIGFYVTSYAQDYTATFDQIDLDFAQAPMDNIGPTVSAGADIDGVRDEPVSLSGTMEDDGFPASPGETTLQWVQTSGPSVSLSDATVLEPSFTPTENGIYSFRLLAFDGEVTTLDDVTVSIQGALPPVFTSDPVTNAVVDEVYSYTVTFTGDDASLSLSAPGLPDWLTLSPGSTNREWTLIGSPAAQDEGTANIQLVAQDAESQATQDFAITVWPAGTNLDLPNIARRSEGNITATTADLNGELLFGQDPVSVKLRYGLTDGGSDGTAWDAEKDLGVQSVGAIAATLTGLTTDTPYFYRFVATNTDGEGQSETGTFTTPLDLSGIQPVITLERPTVESVRIPEGVGLVLETSVTETGGDSGQLTLLWEQITGAGTTTWQSTDTAETVAWFSAQGEYTLRLTADNSVNSDVLEIAVEVVDPSLVNTGSPTTGELPDGWQAANINTPSIDGQITWDENGALMTGARGDIWNSADTFHYVYTTVSGDVDLKARVASLTADGGDPHAWAKTGAMIRETPTAGSKMGLSTFLGDGRAAFYHRTQTDGAADRPGDTPSLAVGSWVRIQRVGNDITASYSTDGNTWNAYTALTISMGTDVTVGLAATSHTSSPIIEVLYDEVYLNGELVDLTQNIGPLVDAGETQTVNTNTQVTLSGTMEDDGLPAPGSVTTEWIQVSGPETINLSDSAALSPTFTPTMTGDTVLRLIAFDGEVATADETTVTTAPTPYEQWLADNNLDPETDTVMKAGREVRPGEAYLLGENPNDPDDVIRITDMSAQADGQTLRLQFPSLENRVYHVQHTEDLTSGSWTTEPTALDGDGQSRHFDVPMASGEDAPKRFYRIRVSFPE